MGQWKRGHRIPILLIFTSGAILLSLSTVVNTAPLSSPLQTSCSPTCRQSRESSKLKYEEGKTYIYDFDTEIVTKLIGTSDESSRVKITGDAVVAAKSACEFVLTVQHVRIAGPTREIKEGVTSLDGSSLRFAYQDGGIEGLCVDPSDPSWSANIKRGFVSMLQNKAVQAVGDVAVTEIDISGRCPTTYTVHGSKYTKTKSLNSCTHRDGGFWLLQGTPYQVSSEQNSVPVINSTQSCEQTLQEGVIGHVECTEIHKLDTLSSNQSRVETTVKTSLQLRGTYDGIETARRSQAFSASSIFFDHSKKDSSSNTARMAMDSTELVLADICSQTKTGTVTPSVPGLINSLRKTIRSLKRVEDFQSIYLKITNGAQCSNSGPLEKIFKDTAAKAGTTESIAFMTKLIAEKKVDKTTQRVFTFYSSFAPKPEAEALTAFSNLISKSDVDHEIILAASALAHRYCRHTECGSNSAYKKLVGQIAQFSRESCMAQEENAIALGVTSLQALGNLDSLPVEAVDAISECMKSSDRIKMRALEAFRQDPCQSDLKKIAFNIFKDYTQGSELRIQAYLAVTRCVQQDDVQEIQKVLDVEKSNQVGSFIASHISNILTSPTPTKRDIRAAFLQFRLPQQFPNDPRKFSTNFDFSKFCPTRNVGFSSEGNLIFNQDSFIPRTITANLEGQFFGRAYKFFEMGIYLEDFEYTIEKLFGPNGKVAKTSRNEISSNAREHFLRMKADVLSRFTRDVSPFDSNVIKEVQNKVTNIKDRFGSNGVMDLYIRSLGTTLLSSSINQEQIRDQIQAKIYLSLLDKFIQGAKDYDVKLTEPITFLDDEYVLPTISGLPLNLELEGTTVLSLQLNGKLDIKNILKQNSISDIQTRILPSAATTIRARMSVGSGPFECGLQLEGKVHAASGVDVSVKRGTGNFEVKVNLPEDKVQVVSIQSSLLWIETENLLIKETPLISKFAAKRSVPFCTASSLIGLQLCAQIDIPEYSATSPSFPFAGDTILGLSIEKTETSMEGYYFKINTEAKSDNEKQVSIEFDTPGSRKNRKITAEGRYLCGTSPKLDLDINIPTQTFKLEYQRWNEEFLRGMDIKLIKNGDEYSTAVKMAMTKSGDNSMIYEPSISYTLHGKSGKLFQGKVIRDFGKELNVDLKMGESLDPALQAKVSGIIKINRENDNNADFILDSLQLENGYFGSLHLDGTATLRDAKKALNVKAKYGLDEQHDLAIVGEFSNPNPKATKFELDVSSSRRSFLNFDIKYNSAYNPNGFENTLLIHRGVDEASKFTISQLSNYNIESNKVFNVKNLIEVTYPTREINFYLKADASNGAEQAGDFELRVGSEVSADIKYKASGTDLQNYDLNGLVNLPKRNIKFSEKAAKLNTTLWKYITSFSCESEGKSPFTFDADTDFILKYERDDTQNEIISRIRTSAYPEEITIHSNVNSRRDLYQAHLKIARTQAEILNLATDFRRAVGNNPSKFTSKAFIANYFDGNLEEIHGRGSSNFNMEGTWIPSGRKVTAVSNLRKQGETYKLDADAQWDALRDVSQSASIRSTTNIGSTSNLQNRNRFSIDSRNNVNFVGNQRELNIVGKMTPEYFNGENSADIQYVAGEGRSYGFSLKAINENNERSKSSLLGVTIALPDEEPFELEFANKAGNINFEKYLLEFSSDLKVKYQGNKNMNIQTEFKSLLTNKRVFTALFDASGTAISQPIKMDFSSELQRGNIRSAGNAKYGQKDGKYEIDIMYDRWSPKKSLDLKYKISTPFPAVRNIEANIRLGYVFTSLTNFEYSESGNVSLNNQSPSTWETGISYLNNDVQLKYNIVHKGQPVVAFGVKGVVGGKKITFKVQNTFRGGNDAKLNLDVEKNLPSLKLNLGIATPFSGYEKIDLTVRHKVNSGPGYNIQTQLQGSVKNDRITLLSKIDLNDDRKFVEFSITDSSKVRKISASINGLRSSNYNLDTMLSSGEHFISTKGKLLKTIGGMEGELTLHSPYLKVDNWNVKVSKTASTNGGNIVSLQAHSSQKEKGSVLIEYAKKDNTFSATFDGTIAVRYNEAEWGGIFQLDDKIYNMQRDNEEGRGMEAVFQLKSEKHPVKIIFAGKRTTGEYMLSTSLCGAEDNCKISEASMKWLTGGAAGKGYTLSVSSKKIEDGKTVSDGIELKSVSKYNMEKKMDTSFEHSAKLMTNGGEADEDEIQEHTIGYRIFRDLDIAQPKSGIEVYFPNQRQIGLIHTHKVTEVDENLIEFWLDRLKNPKEKLSMSIIRDKSDLYTVVLKHPKLEKDLQVRCRVEFNQQGYIINTITELYFFKDAEPLSLTFKVKQGNMERSMASIYGVDFAVKGLVTLSTHSDITVGAGELLTKTKFEYLNRQKQQRNYEFVLDYGFNHRTLELIGPEGRIGMYSSRYSYHMIPGTNRNDGYEVRRELFLPGMADSRIFQNSITTTFPPSAHIKMYTANSPSGEFYEAWVGFRNDQHFTAGIYSNEGSRQEVIADLNVALNNSRLLFVKTTWDKQNIKNFLEKSNDRITDTALRFHRVRYASREYLQQEATHVGNTITQSLPSLKPVLQYYKDQWSILENELEESEVLNHYLRHYFDFLLNVLGTDVEGFKRQITGIKSAFEHYFNAIVKSVGKVPALINNGIKSMPKVIEAMTKGLNVVLDTLVESSRLAVKGITDAIERISKNNPAIANQMEYLSDTSKGVGKILNEALTVTLQRLTKLWKTLQASTSDIIESEMFRDYVKYYGRKYQDVAVDLIGEYKRDLEVFRDSVLGALPDEDVRDLMESVAEYVERKSRMEPVDDQENQAKIYKKIVKALKKIKSNLFTVDLDNGIVIAQIPLPMPVKSLTEMDQAIVSALANHKFKRPSYSYGLREIYNQFKTPSGLTDIVPPFKATGIIIGSQYYKTFDNKFYHFEGKCQYILASDFVDKNFTIFVTYEEDSATGEVKKAIALTDHKHSITILPDNTAKIEKVTADTTGEMELKLESLLLDKEKWTVAKGRGFSVSCSTIRDVCFVRISGFYQGKTNGLLGTYNNEIFDDMNSPNGEIVATTEQMVEGWKMGTCQEKPLPVHFMPTDSLALNKCSDAFAGRSSELRPCFGVVKGANYQSTCESLSKEKGYDAKRAVCTVSSAYREMCRIHGATIEDSEQCLTN